ncbi:MAG: peptide ABC transporter substrate-binding protein [Anaerolineales bacterium]
MLSRFYGRLGYLAGMLLFASLLVGCASEGGDLPTPTSFSVEDTQVGTQDTTTEIAPPTPTSQPRRLTICIADEPDTLFVYGGDSLAQRHVLQAIYDGPIDMQGYQYHAVILEKLPSLADGDAHLEPMSVAAGDLVVNAAGQLVRLELGELVRPFGCANSECAVPWDGSALELPQLSATFTLKPGIKWSDGTPLTAEDSVFSYQLATQCEAEGNNCGGLGLSNRNGWEMLPRTASYTAIDDRNVRWTGVPGFLDPAYQANFFIPLPEHQLAQYSLQELFAAPEAARQPLGWGPYAVQSWVAGESISLRANPLYSGAQETGVSFDELLFRFIGQENTNLNLIQSGACDLIDQAASRTLLESSLQEINQMESTGQLQSYFAAGPVWEHVDYGILPLEYDDGYLPGGDRPDFFSDVRVRQAFALCMDRDRVADEVLRGLSNVPGSYLPEEHPLYNPDLTRYEFDPAAGGQLLQEAGWVDHDADPTTPRQAIGIQGILDGTPLVVSYTTSQAEQRQAAMRILVESLAGCGIQVEAVVGPAEQVYAPGPEGPVFGRRFDLAQFAWSASYQPACQLWTSRQIPGDPNLENEDGSTIFPYGWGGVNAAGYRDSEYDRACETALGTLPGQPGYIENHQAVQMLFSNQLPVVPLYQHVNLALSRADMCGFSFDPSAISEFWNIENFDHGLGCK